MLNSQLSGEIDHRHHHRRRHRLTRHIHPHTHANPPPRAPHMHMHTHRFPRREEEGGRTREGVGGACGLADRGEHRSESMISGIRANLGLQYQGGSTSVGFGGLGVLGAEPGQETSLPGVAGRLPAMQAGQQCRGARVPCGQAAGGHSSGRPSMLRPVHSPHHQQLATKSRTAWWQEIAGHPCDTPTMAAASASAPPPPPPLPAAAGWEAAAAADACHPSFKQQLDKLLG